MRICIHRGASQIGGSCVELESRGDRILLDLGLPLDADEADPKLLPPVRGLREPDASLLATLLSHGHRDHWGLIPSERFDLPVFMGEATHRIMQSAAKFVPDACVPENVRHLADRRSFELGPFRITPFLVDHSAYDAYALLVEADGRRVFYSGDFRGHGRKSKLFERLLAAPPEDIDVLLMEGSSIGRLGENASFPTEDDIEAALVDRFGSTPGMPLVFASAQNIDRMVSIAKACKTAGRTLIMDLYAAEILRATGNARIPQSHWLNLALFVPEWQRRHIARHGLFTELDRHRMNRIFPERLKSLASRSVFLCRSSMMGDLERADALRGARAIWSQWEGYLKEGRGLELTRILAAKNVPLELLHTSGHASIPDLKRLAAALQPKSLVAIHTFGAAEFPNLFANVVSRRDGEWWEV